MSIKNNQDIGIILIGAIIFTTAFLWKDWIDHTVDLFFSFDKSGMLYRLIFTVIITILMIYLIEYLKDTYHIPHLPSPSIELLSQNKKEKS